MKKFLLCSGLIIFFIFIFIIINFLVCPPESGEMLARGKDIPYPMVIAHRGASGIAPESTKKAFELARDMGSDYLEADLQRTKDGVIIIFHDDTPKRTTNAAEIFPGRENDFIETFTYEELMLLDAGSWFNEAYPRKAREEFAGFKIITLNDLIDIVETGNNKPGLYLEIKGPPRHPGIEEDIFEILKEREWLPNNQRLDPPDTSLNKETGVPTVNIALGKSAIIIQSFYPESLEKFRDLAPVVPRSFLINLERVWKNGWKNTMEYAAEIGQGIGPGWYISFPCYFKSARENDLLIHPYTINKKWQMSLMMLLKADGFFTDYPHLALELYQKSDPIDIEQLF